MKSLKAHYLFIIGTDTKSAGTGINLVHTDKNRSKTISKICVRKFDVEGESRSLRPVALDS